ncbi:DNA-binding protein [Streptomyces virginiae]|uniref:DNA-binding protein n=1 Tax=Streptomyces virginiae TaxID=1961 RepID=A0A0L8M0J2_STRVG|nr:WhiB family transcriptional regulator [Streptomyces virginiae]KOG43936.1 DNA-binding protein [Streptomyces virginiae]
MRHPHTASEKSALTSLAALTDAIENLGVHAPCLALDPEVFFSDFSADVDYARAFCRMCPMVDDCLSGALARREPWGVWGGELFVKGVIRAQANPGQAIDARI